MSSVNQFTTAAGILFFSITHLQVVQNNAAVLARHVFGNADDHSFVATIDEPNRATGHHSVQQQTANPEIVHHHRFIAGEKK